ncbi:MAG: 3'(2'),5'-bisphosphate nucleotidase [Robiginitomaculum sp.]|nr:MAG: 3'(2'),5'-bisphosphate nucleotidase [Robiginitomaculum sp.]
MHVNAQQLEALISSVLAAGRVILEIRENGFTAEVKSDGSPVTEADRQAEQILLQTLAEQFVDIPVIAEEQVAAGILPEPGDLFFLVDALDGTKEFVRGGCDFTVNIGLIEQGIPVFGIVYAPADGRIFVGAGANDAWQARINCREKNGNLKDKKLLQVMVADPQNLRAVASKSHRDEQTNDWLREHNIRDVVSAGSSIKFCLLATAEADIYPRFGPTCEWDTAAGHAVLQCAGGQVTRIDGSAFLYGKAEQEKPYLNPGFIARAGVSV